MNSLFNMDSPLVRFLNRIADLMILNCLFMLCCLPVFTIGASLTALHYVCYKMVREEDGYIARSFFRSFRENFLQATLIWLLLLVGWLLVGTDILMARAGSAFPVILRYFIYADAVLLLAVGLYAFPLQARFENPVLRTLRNAVLLMIGAFPRTVAMLAVMLMPLLILLFFPRLLPVFVMFGFSAPVYACASLYAPVFRNMEGPAEGTEENAGEEGEEPFV